MNREQFLAQERQIEQVELPNGQVAGVREMSVAEYADWVALWANRENGELKIDNQLYTASLLVRCVVDERGERVYQDGELELVRALPQGIARPLIAAAERINGVAPEAVRDARKN